MPDKINYLEKAEGNLFFIPLFLPTDNVKENIKSYTKYKFLTSESYAIGRLIKMDASAGDLVEIFNYVGPIPTNPSSVIARDLLIPPLHVAMAFGKNRWRFIAETPNYNCDKDSNFQNLGFLLGDVGARILSLGDKQMRISEKDSEKYPSWIVYPGTKVEEMIKNLNRD